MAGQRPTLIGIPWDVNSSFLRGAAAAPPLVRQALFSPASNMWTESGVDLGAPGRLADAGDLALPDSADAIGMIEGAVGLLLDDGGAPTRSSAAITRCTYPVLRAIARRHPGLTILHIDAHPDLYDEFEGQPPLPRLPLRPHHGGGARRAAWCRWASGRGTAINVSRLSVSASRRSTCGRGRPESGPSVAGPVYVSIDLDGLDPAFAPGVSHREPGGLSVRDVLGLLHALPSPPSAPTSSNSTQARTRSA